MRLTLSKEELHEWTGYVRPSKQIKALKRIGVRFHVGPDGHPKVLRTDIKKPQNSPRNTPNLEALRRLG